MMEADEDAHSTLTVMFGEQGWDSDTLGEILSSNDGDVQAAIDEILAAGTCENWILQRFHTITVSHPPELPRPTKWKVITVVAPANGTPGDNLEVYDSGRRYVIQVPRGVKPGKRFGARIPDYDVGGSNSTVQAEPDIANPLVSA